jgi:hypothetical protein
MKKENFGLIFAISVPMLICFVSYGFAIYFPVIAAATKDGGMEQWLGFFGNIIGAGVTLLAAGIAWIAVHRQIDAQKEALTAEIERDKDREAAELARDAARQASTQMDAKFSAKAILVNPIMSAATAWGQLRSTLRRIDVLEAKHATPDEMKDALEVRLTSIRGSYQQLEANLSHFGIAQVAQELSGVDKLNFLVVISTLHAAYINFKNLELLPYQGYYREALDSQIGWFSNLETLIATFDQKLAVRYLERAVSVANVGASKT